MLRVLAGFVVASFPAAIAQVLVLVALRPGRGGAFDHPVPMFLFVGANVYACQILLGIPLWLVLRRRRPATLRLYAISGLAIVLMPMVMAVFGFSAITKAQLVVPRAVYTFASFALSGLAVGALYWSIARPDLRKHPGPEALARRFE